MANKDTLTLGPNASLSDCQHYSVLLCGVLEGVMHLDNEGHRNSCTAISEVAEAMAEELSLALEKLEASDRRRAA